MGLLTTKDIVGHVVMEEQRAIHHPGSISKSIVLPSVWNDTSWQRWKRGTSYHHQNGCDIARSSKCVHRSAITALYRRVWATLSRAYQTLFWSRISKGNGCWRYQHVHEKGNGKHERHQEGNTRLRQDRWHRQWLVFNKRSWGIIVTAIRHPIEESSRSLKHNTFRHIKIG